MTFKPWKAFIGKKPHPSDVKRKDNLRQNYSTTDHEEDLESLVEDLKTNIDAGLTTEFAKCQIEREGRNELTPPPETPSWKRFVKELFGNTFCLMLWFAGILCFVAYFARDDSANLYLGIVLICVVFITGFFSFYQNGKSENLMKSFKSMSPPQVKVIRDGKVSAIESQVICRGDIILLEGGDLVPADCRVIECSDNMVVDHAALTGESEPQKRNPLCTHNDPMETQNLLFFGTSVPEGSCKAVVCRIGDETLMGQIAGLAMGTDTEQTPINKEIEHFITIIFTVAFCLGVAFLLIAILKGTDPFSATVFAISIIVANVPEGLLVTVTVSLTLTAKRMAKKHVLVKNLEGVETLGSTSCICSDKTGTLTQNIMTVVQVVYGQKDGMHIEDCESSFTKGNKTMDENSLGFQALQRCATLCNVAIFKSDKSTPFKKLQQQGDGSSILVVNWEAVGNASEIAMIKLCQPFRDIDEYHASNPCVFKIPFNSKNKYQIHVCIQEQYGPPQDNVGPRVVLMKGAPERIIDRCNEVLLDDEVVPMTPKLRQRIEEHQETLSRNGLRVLGFAHRELSLDEYPPDYNYSDGKGEGYSTPNFPQGDWKEAEKLETDGGSNTDPPIHPKSKPGLVFLGLMALIDPPREAVPYAVGRCKMAGIKVIMVTGDHPITAQAIAYKVGILWSKTRGEMEASNKRYNLEPGDLNFEDPENARAIIVPGWDISVDMPQEKWDAILEHPQIVFARTSPQQKLIIVENNQRLGHIVAVTGDGVNDSPALKKADIGIAMGIMGSSVSKQAADMILLDDNFASIVAGVEEGRLIFDNLKKSIAYTLTSNIPEIAPFLSFIVLDIPLPLSTVLILAIDLGTDMCPAISMSYEEPEADIMRRPPRNAAVDRLVTRKLICFAYLQIGIMQACAGFFAWMVVLNDYGYPPHILLGLGLGDFWGKQPLVCKFHGGNYVALDGTISQTLDPTLDPPTADYPFWTPSNGGYVINCEHMPKFFDGAGDTNADFDQFAAWTYLQNSDNAASEAPLTDERSRIDGTNALAYEGYQLFASEGYFDYTPWASRTSSFWDDDWLTFNVENDDGIVGSLGGRSNNIFFQFNPPGVYSICLSSPYSDFSNPDLPQNGNQPVMTKDTKNIVRDSDLTIAAATTECMSDTLGDCVPYPLNITACNHSSNGQDGVRFGINSDGSMIGYNSGVFCNGDGTVRACTALDDAPYNSFYCTQCSPGCTRVNSTERKTDVGATGDDCYGNPDTSGCPNWNEGYEQCTNIGNRQSQKEALTFAQTAFFVAIVIVQWADLLICKTRWLSISTQGLRNGTMNFGLYFETLLAAYLCYCIPLNAIGTRPLRLAHWFPAMPFAMLIFFYDEIRKYLMRLTSPEVIDKATGQARRIPGWVERNTYY